MGYLKFIGGSKEVEVDNMPPCTGGGKLQYWKNLV